MSATPYSNLLPDRRSTPPLAGVVRTQCIPRHGPLWQPPIEITVDDWIHFVLGEPHTGLGVSCSITNNVCEEPVTFVLTSPSWGYSWKPPKAGTYVVHRLSDVDGGVVEPDPGTIHVGSETK